jgi:hypothetical protein
MTQVPVRCYHFVVPKALALHLNFMREAMTNGERRRVRPVCRLPCLLSAVFCLLSSVCCLLFAVCRLLGMPPRMFTTQHHQENRDWIRTAHKCGVAFESNK